MRKLLYDLYQSQPVGSTKFHGGGEYIKAVFLHLVEQYNDQIQITICYNKDKFLDDWLLELIIKYKLPCYDVKSIENIKTILNQEKFDVFYSGIPYGYKRDDFPKDIVVKGTIHGLRGIELPTDRYEYKYSNGKNRCLAEIRYLKNNIVDQYQRRIEDFEEKVKVLDAFITDSEHTKYALLTAYPQLKNRNIPVLYPPAKRVIETECDCILPVSGKYILLIGGDRWLKNSYRALIALDRLYSSGMIQEYRTVLVGDISERIKRELQNHRQFDFLGYVSTPELEALYQNCDMFLYPSLNEGFGYPPLEAMKYGTTCVVSAVCSLPEVCGDSVYYVNPYDIREIENRVLHAANKKIPKEQVLHQYDKILERQNRDLDGICQFIID